MTTVLSARDLGKGFGGFPAGGGLSLDVAAGERVALLGPNGAGKTTTLLMLLGAIEPDAGTIELVGHRLPPPPHLKIIEALEYFAVLYGMRRPRPAIDDALDRFRIGALADRRCEQLS